MRTATRLAATSLLLMLPVLPAIGADDPNCAKIGDNSDHREQAFTFTKGSTWRMIITTPLNVQITHAADAVSLANKMAGNNQKPGCSQYLLTFDTPSTFTVAAGKTEIVKNGGTPDCDWAAGLSQDQPAHFTGTDGFTGRIEMYCFDRGSGPRHYANMVIWNLPQKLVYGALYAITEKAKVTPVEYFGYGADGEYAGVQVNLVPQGGS